MIQVNLGDLVQMTFYDELQSAIAGHPMHFHGYNVAVVAVGNSIVPLTAQILGILEKQGKMPVNLISPPMKDTFIVPDKGWTTIRFIADNPGYWLVHCHLEIHTIFGMGLIVKVSINFIFRYQI